MQNILPKPIKFKADKGHFTSNGIFNRQTALIVDEMCFVFEGGDFSGKTTQCNIICDELRKMNLKCEKMSFPDRSTVIGKLIDSYLKNKLELEDHVIHLLFSSNRWEKNKMVKDLLMSGHNIIMDRYSYSGVAFSSAKPDMDFKWCKMSDAGLIAPDLIIYLNVSPEKIEDRLNSGDERYENISFQKNVRSQFFKLFESNWKVIDADHAIEDVTKTILHEIEIFIDSFNQDKQLNYLWS